MSDTVLNSVLHVTIKLNYFLIKFFFYFYPYLRRVSAHTWAQPVSALGELDSAAKHDIRSSQREQSELLRNAH